MKNTLSLNKKTLFFRFGAFLTAAVMLLSAAACTENKADVSSDDSFTELKVDELDTDMTDSLTRFTDWYYVDEGQKKVYDSAKAGDGSTNILRNILGDAGCADWSKYPVSQPKEVYNEKNSTRKNGRRNPAARI